MIAKKQNQLNHYMKAAFSVHCKLGRLYCS